MKLGAAGKASKASTAPAAAPKKRGRKPGTKVNRDGSTAKNFTAEVILTGRQNGERFASSHEIAIKASSLIGAAGRAARTAFTEAKKTRQGKCKWLEANVIVYPTMD